MTTKSYNSSAHINLSRDQAQAVVACWRANGLWGAVNHMWPDVRIPWQVHCKVVVAGWNKLASDACWDGKFDLAVKYLIKYGMDESVRRTVDTQRWGNKKTTWRRVEKVILE